MTHTGDAESRSEPWPGMVLIISGPSGSGKSSLVARLIECGEFPIDFSVSATTRAPRPGEVDGQHYYFLSRERFGALRDQAAFLEYAEVFGNYYGTLREPVVAALSRGRWVLLEIDVQGARQVKGAMPAAVSFFIRTPSWETYEERMRTRGTETTDTISIRLARVVAELSFAAAFDFQIVNESLDQADRTLRTLLHGLVHQREERTRVR